MAVSNLLLALRSSRLRVRVSSSRLNEHVLIGKTGFLGFDVPSWTLAAASPSLRAVGILELRRADILNHGFGLTAILAEVEFRRAEFKGFDQTQAFLKRLFAQLTPFFFEFTLLLAMIGNFVEDFLRGHALARCKRLMIRKFYA